MTPTGRDFRLAEWINKIRQVQLISHVLQYDDQSTFCDEQIGVLPSHIKTNYTWFYTYIVKIIMNHVMIL